jgi:hypothetical protein
MSTNKNTASTLEDVQINVKLKLSALWITMMLLYIYADILSLFRPGELDEILKGFMGPFPATQGSLLVAAIMMMIPAIMVFLSLILKPRLNRGVNIVLGALYILVNIGNVIGESWAYYLLFGVVEIVIASLIIWFAWKWPQQAS